MPLFKILKSSDLVNSFIICFCFRYSRFGFSHKLHMQKKKDKPRHLIRNVKSNFHILQETEGNLMNQFSK